MFYGRVYGSDWIPTKSLHEYLAINISYNKKVMKRCGLSRIPSRRTFDRRLVTISNDIKNRITTLGELFVHDKNN